MIFDRMNILSPPQYMVYSAIFRKTIGWGKISDKIAVKQLMLMSGLTRPTVRSAINQLIAIGAISRIQGKGKVPAILRIEMKWLEALVGEKQLSVQGKKLSHKRGQNVFPTKDIPDLKETSSSKRTLTPVSLQDFKQELMQEGWFEEEVDEAFKKLQEQPEGKVKYPRKWILSVLQSIRDYRQIVQAREKEQNEKRREEERLMEEGNKKENEENVKKIKQAQENRGLAERFYGRSWIKESGQNCVRLYIDGECYGGAMGFDDISFRKMLLECMEKEADPEDYAVAKQLIELMG
ncbi:MAG: replication protein [Chlamydiales bacterium]|nr:replication protein [Chlamydiales bacterium]